MHGAINLQNEEEFFTPGKTDRVKTDGLRVWRCISQQKQLELSSSFQKSSPVT